jgi:Cys-rich repeat protein
MRCHTERWQECSGWAGPTCARGEVCDAGPAPEPTCTEHTRSACAERYNLPCEADADCGSGFECTESVSTSCSGGGSVRPDGDGGYIVETFPAECTSEPTGEYYCKLLDLPCATDAECPEGFSCEAYFTTPPCAGGGSSLGGTGAGTPAVVDCGTPPAPTFACKPSRYSGGGGVVGGGGTGGGSSGDPNGSADAGVQGPGSGAVGGVGGAGGGAAGGTGTRDAGASPPDDGEAEEDGHGHGSRRLGRLLRRLFGPGGCSLTGAVPAGDLSWLALASLLAGVALRRRRACSTR